MFFNDLHQEKELAADGDFKAALRCARYYKAQGDSQKMSRYLLLANQNVLLSNVSSDEKVVNITKIMKVLCDIKEYSTSIASKPEC